LLPFVLLPRPIFQNPFTQKLPAKKFCATSPYAVISSLKRQKQCPAIGRFSKNSLTAGMLLRKSKCEASLRARFFRLKTRAGFVGFVARTCHSLDWVRLALPRSPESGFAVSAYVKFLSREKRNISLENFLYVYILWWIFCSPHIRNLFLGTTSLRLFPDFHLQFSSKCLIALLL